MTDSVEEVSDNNGIDYEHAAEDLAALYGNEIAQRCKAPPDGYSLVRLIVQQAIEHDRRTSSRRAIANTGEGVTVKPLEWRKTGKVLWTAETFYGTYGIERQSDQIGHTFWCWFKSEGWSAETVSGYNSTLDAAKVTAQGEHEQRILPALSPAPSQTGGEVGYVSTSTLAYLKGRVAHVECSVYAAPVSIHNIPLYASPVIAPAVEVGINSAQRQLMAAYHRGVTWARENGPTEAETQKAAYDYADKMTSALTSTPASALEGVAGKGEQRTICEACGNSNLAHDRAVWTDDGTAFCPKCTPALDLPAPTEAVEYPTADRHYDDIDDPHKTGLADLLTSPQPATPAGGDGQ